MNAEAAEENLRERIRGAVNKAVVNFLYYDRKEDEQLPLHDLEYALMNDVITREELIEMFAEEIRE